MLLGSDFFDALNAALAGAEENVVRLRRLRYLLVRDMVEKMTHEQVAALLGISRQRVSQLLKDG